MENVIREMYFDLSVEDKKTFRAMVMKRFSLSEESVYNRINGRTPFSLCEDITIKNWFEKKEKYCIKRNEETFALIGITQNSLEMV